MPALAEYVRLLVINDENGITELLSPAASEAGRQPFSALPRRTGAAAPVRYPMSNPRQVLSKAQILGTVWSDTFVPMIHTVRGVGCAVKCPEERT
jgi:hypothetical protein